MTGFQIILCILFGIIAFFILVLSIPVHVSLGFDDKINVSIRYLFIKLNILPTDPNKKKKEKKPKAKKEKPPEEEKPKEPDEPKKPNPILEMVKANGYDGMMIVITNLGKILGKYGGKIFKSIVFDDIELYISVGTGDAAATAIKYGKTCQQVYPVFGYICSHHLVRKYEVNVEPDFLANNTEGELYIDMNITVRKIINATIAMVFRLLFKVLLKFLKGAKNKKPQTTDGQPQSAEPVNSK
ncbi:MAG: DUF2953 domain-containing protein [Acutalibacteraceae bacterium]